MLSNWLHHITQTISLTDWALIITVMTSNLLLARFGMWPYSLVTFPGTLAHELMHFLMAAILFASPSFPNMLPRRSGNTWTMGSVAFVPSLVNAIPIALAPLALLPLGLFLALSVMHPSTGWSYMAFGWIVGNMLFACLPSRQDWKIAGPSLVLVLLLAILLYFLLPFDSTYRRFIRMQWPISYFAS
jgi:hypothetical protein